MLRLYDTRLREAAEIRPARSGLLRVHLDAPVLAGPAHLGDIRMYVLADLIRRNAERHHSSVIVCQDAADAGGLPATDCSALNIGPADLDCTAPTAPGAGLAVELGIGELADPGSTDLPANLPRGDAAGTAPAAMHRDVRHWVRSGPVLFDGRDMPALDSNAPDSNVVRLADVSARGLDSLAVRLAFLGARYRDRLNLTWDLLVAADAEVRRLRELVATWANEPSKPICAAYWTSFTDALDDDLDTPAALTALRDLIADSEVPAGSKFETFAAGDRVLGLELVSLVGKLPA